MPRTKEPEDPDEYSLVIQALTSGSRDRVEWQSDGLVERVRNAPDMGRLRPQHIKEDLIEAVVECPDMVIQVREKRPEYSSDRSYYYKVILTYDEVPHDVFVEIILNDPDPEWSAVTIVNVHLQRRG